MSPELEQIYDELVELSDERVDLPFLEALANNALYVLAKMQRSEEPRSPEQRALIDSVIVDVLNTTHKELLWAQQDADDKAEQLNWYVKARRQFLRDLKRLFDEGGA